MPVSPDRAQAQYTGPSRDAREEQFRRALGRAHEEQSSIRRLTEAWRERDAEIEARVGDDSTVEYKFRCKHCGSRFSLAQQCTSHEVACGMVNERQEDKASQKAARIILCKYCKEPQADFVAYSRHRWSEHRKEVLVEQEKARTKRQADEGKIDQAIHREPGDGAAAPRPRGRPRAQAAETPSGSRCPLCNAILSGRIAELIKELTAAGLSQDQAFSSARIAQRILGTAI